MTPTFPNVLEGPLPSRISPCPIVEAILEIRFSTTKSWRMLPGLLLSTIREKYPKTQDLPLAQVPEEVRRKEPNLTYKPLVQYQGKDFIIQLGPFVVSLVTKQHSYPGWQALRAEMEWLVEMLKKSGFVEEGKRLGVRYVNFFDFDVFSKLNLEVKYGENSLADSELGVVAVLKQPPFKARLQVSNNVTMESANKVCGGSVVDVDVWLGSLDFEPFVDSMEKFTEAHELEKQIFFALLKHEFLSTLNPEYA